jgi:hypothetical protein
MPETGQVSHRPAMQELCDPQHIDDAVSALDLVLSDAERQQLETAYEPHDPVGF